MLFIPLAFFLIPCYNHCVVQIVRFFGGAWLFGKGVWSALPDFFMPYAAKLGAYTVVRNVAAVWVVNPFAPSSATA